MKVGSLVECIDDKIPEWALCYHTKLIVKGKIYTIRGFNRNGEGVYLEEIASKKNECTGREQSFRITRFREVLPPMQVSIQNIIEKEYK